MDDVTLVTAFVSSLFMVEFAKTPVRAINNRRVLILFSKSDLAHPAV